MQNNYAEQFNELLNSEGFKNAINNMPEDLWGRVPGITKQYFMSLLFNVSALLEFVDKGKISEPYYLYDRSSNTYLPDSILVRLNEKVNQNLFNDQSFFNEILHEAYHWRESLSKAASDPDIDDETLKGFRERKRKLRDMLLETSALLAKEKEDLEEVHNLIGNATAVKENSDQRLKIVEENHNKIAEIKAQAFKTYYGIKEGSSGEIPDENSFNKLYEKALSASGAIDTHNLAISNILTRIGNIETTINTNNENAQKTLKLAEKILEDSSEAGLAGAFIAERKKLEKSSRLWATLFVFILLGVFLYGYYIYDDFKDTLESISQGKSVNLGWLILFFRISVMGPLIWLAIVISSEFKNTQKMRHDYTAKAATALAYRRFKEETSDDEELRNKLLDVAIQRYSEHPVRFYEEHLSFKDAKISGSKLNENVGEL